MSYSDVLWRVCVKHCVSIFSFLSLVFFVKYYLICIFKLRAARGRSSEPAEWLVSLVLRGGAGAEQSAGALGAAVPALLRAAADLHLSRGHVAPAHYLYCLSQVCYGSLTFGTFSGGTRRHSFHLSRAKQ